MTTHHDDRADLAREERGKRMSDDLFPRCPRCGCAWHGLGCRNGCPCLTSWVEPVEVAG